MPAFAPPTSRPTYADPAQQAAMGLCLMAHSGVESRLVGTAKERHGERCFFCDFAPDVLTTYLAEFRDWEPTFEGQRVLSAWRAVNPHRQRERVDHALHPSA